MSLPIALICPARCSRTALLLVLMAVFVGCAGLPVDSPPPESRIPGDTLTLAWTYTAAGPINAPPLRVDKVVITAPVNGPLLALSVDTGQLRWQFDPPGRLWERSYASDGERVFVGSEGGKLSALSVETGEVLWQRDLDVDVQIAPHVSGSVLFTPTTFVGSGLPGDPNGKATLFALSTMDGQELWAFQTDNYILQTPFVQEGVVYVAGSYSDPAIEVDEGGPMRLYALNASDGTPRWMYESTDGFVKAVYATGEVVAYIAYQDFVIGVDAQTGTPRWRKDTGNWVPSLAGYGDVVYFGSANTVVHALNIADGEHLWRYNIGGGTFNYLLGVPVRVLDELYFLTQQGDIIALNAQNGNLLWQKSTGIVGARVGLSVSGGWLFIGDGEGRVYAFTARRKSPYRPYFLVFAFVAVHK